jgi:DNA-binding beta-propeller fold protein YncE
VFGTPGTEPGALDYPYDVDVHGGEIFVADSHNDRVQVFDLGGRFLRNFGSTGNGDGQFSRNRGLCASELGIYVTDAKNDRVQAFDLAGMHRWSRGSIGDGLDEFFRPRGIDITATGQLVVCDADNHRVKILRPNGSTRTVFGRRSSAEGDFVAPFDVAISNEGKVYVVDIFNSRVQAFTLDGEFLFSFGVSGTGDGEFLEPRAIACGPAGLLAVSDVGKSQQARDRIQVFDANGTFLCGFASTGSGEGEIRFVTGLAFDSEGRIYVAEAPNHRVSVWAAVTVQSETESVGSLKSRFSGE